MADLRALDAEARAKAQQEFVRPVVLEAGAGTGKTAALVARILSWSLGPGWERHARILGGTSSAPEQDERAVAERVLSGVVAITFTEAASHEMAERVASALELCAQGGRPPSVLDEVLARPEARARARALGRSIDHLVVRTIHGFCRRVLASSPLDAGLHPDFQVDADGNALRKIAQEVVEQDLRRPERLEVWLRFAARGIDPRQLQDALAVIVESGLPPEALANDPCGPEALAALRSRFRARLVALADAIGDRLEFVARVEGAQAVLSWVQTTRMALDAVEGVGETTPRVDSRVRDRLLGWGRGRFTESEAQVLPVERVRLAAADLALVTDHVARVDAPRLREIQALLFPLLGQVRDTFRARGSVTFQSLLEEATHLLASDPAVAARVRGQIDQLLVDEFQDTDALQCDLVRALALTGDPRPGLFVVGDPKQALYGWRSADLAAYEGFVSELERSGGLVHALSVNFRSAPAILMEVERVCAPVMQAALGLQPPFRPLEPHRVDSPGFQFEPWAPVEHWVTWPLGDDGEPSPDHSSALATELEARAVAGDLRRLHDRTGLPWDKAAILLRSTTDLDVYLSALREHGIPYEVDRDRSYFLRREVIEAAALLRAVVDPTDQMALLTLFRSAWVGVPDVALLPLWRAGLPGQCARIDGTDPSALELAFGIVEGRRDEARLFVALPDWPEALRAGLLALHLARRSWQEDDAETFLRRVRDLFAVDATESARYLGAYRLANIDGLFRSVEKALLSSEGAITEVLDVLRKSVKEAREAPEELVHTSSSEAVQVMTVHRAKGLDFDHCYLVQLHKESRPRQGAFHRIVRGPRPELVLFGIPTPGYDEVERVERARESAERVRLLYVAMTRARERVVLSGAWPRDVLPVPLDIGRSFLDLVVHRRGGSPVLASTVPVGERAAVVERGALWVLPALWAAPETTGAVAGRDLAVDPERARRHRRHLEGLRVQARARVERPRVGGVTGIVDHAVDQRRTEPGDTARDDAAIAGTLIHALLEGMDHDTPKAARLAWASAEVERRLLRIEPARRAGAATRLASLLDALAGGRVLDRLGSLSGHIVGRELPLVLPPRDRGPVGALTGAIDLVYEDPLDGQLVVVDYKTGRKKDDPGYALQGALYARAVQEALGLPTPPRFEIWWLASDDPAVPRAPG